MERCVCFHRFGVLFCLSLSLSTGICGSTRAAVLSNAQPFSAQTLSAPSVPTETRSAQSAAPQQSKSGEYVLSQDRYEKAVTYSRAAYTMYFVAVGLNVLALVILLRLGIAAKFRDCAESGSAC